MIFSIDNKYIYECKINKSKFIALAFPLINVKDVNNILQNTKKNYKGAKHYCYAYKLGIRDYFIKICDDGEPSKTAGQQILNQINSFNLTNIIIIVVRYFGGVLLGVSGLIKAYKTSSKKVLEKAKIITKEITFNLKLEFNIKEYNNIMYAVKKFNAQIIKYDSSKILLIIELPIINKEQFLNFLNNKNINIEDYNL